MALLYVALSLTLVIFSVVYYLRKLLHAHLCNRFSKFYNSAMGARKRRLFDGLMQLKPDGRVVIVDVGCGPGTNFQFYPPGSEIICVEPNRHCESLVRDNVRQFPDVRVSRFLVGGAEDLRDLVEAGSADAVVVTLVLCTVNDVARSLHEIVRVLKPVSSGLYAIATGSRVQVSVLDTGAVGPGLKSQPPRCRVTVLGKLFTPGAASNPRHNLKNVFLTSKRKFVYNYSTNTIVINWLFVYLH